MIHARHRNVPTPTVVCVQQTMLSLNLDPTVEAEARAMAVS